MQLSLEEKVCLGCVYFRSQFLYMQIANNVENT